MKKNKGKYRVVKELPINAMRMEDYANKMDITPQTLYMRVMRGTATFEIVTFHDINFILF